MVQTLTKVSGGEKYVPSFYGVVVNPMHYDYEVVGDVSEGKSNVIFVTREGGTNGSKSTSQT